MSDPSFPKIGITMGDPAGIGPEIAVKAFAAANIYNICRPLLIGNSILIEKAIKFTGIFIRLNVIHHVKDAKCKKGIIDLIEIEGEDVDQIKPGEIYSLAGDLAFRSVKKVIELALSKELDATVTGPINKAAMNSAGHHFAGHTEIYAQLTNTPKYAMLLVDEKIKVIHVSTHVSLRKACDLVKKERVLEVIHLMNASLKMMGNSAPHIAVAGLNPHASDNGLFGDEEMNEIIPAIKEARKEGLHVDGPVPPDTLFALMKGGKFDGCVAMYHDQGHIPFKMSGFHWDEENKRMKTVKGVNITLGLPIIRTSVDHGTAFEIAGRGIASPDALILAIEYAVRLHHNKDFKNE